MTLWNHAAEVLLGFDADSAKGKRIGDVFGWLEPELDSKGRFGTDAHPLQLQKRPLQLGGQDKLVDVLAYPLVSNGVEGIVVRIDDVTSRVSMEEMLLQSEKMATVGSLAGGMAHEINNPLAGILQSVQMIRRRLGPDLPANRKAAEAHGCDMQAMLRYLEQREVLFFLDAVQESGERAARIVRNMLGFIRRSASGRVDTDMASLLDDTLEIARADYDLKKKYDFRKIEIVRDYAEGVPPLSCSATEMEQVYYNLIANAAQAMSLKKGPGYRPRLTLRVQAEDGCIVVELEDNGPGMTEEVRRRAFEPLFTTKQAGEGTGLGLPLAYFIVVNTYGGEILLDSAPGEGTRFTLRFPLQAEGDHV